MCKVSHSCRRWAAKIEQRISGLPEEIGTTESRLQERPSRGEKNSLEFLAITTSHITHYIY